MHSVLCTSVIDMSLLHNGDRRDCGPAIVVLTNLKQHPGVSTSAAATVCNMIDFLLQMVPSDFAVTYIAALNSK